MQDVKLLQNVDVTKGLRPGGWILLNIPDIQSFENLKALNNIMGSFSDYRLAAVDATKIALEHHLGTRTHPLINTAMIGAFARIMKNPPIESVAEAIKTEISVKVGQNIEAARHAYNEVQY